VIKGDRVTGVLVRTLPLLFGDKRTEPMPITGTVAYVPYPSCNFVWVEDDSDKICRLVIRGELHLVTGGEA
jgi:hypothetical protein